MDEETLARFEKYIDKSGECWLWTGFCNPDGYGEFWFKDKSWRSYRLMYLHHHGELPEKPLVIRHNCKSKNCCNPGHLEPGTIRENQLDRHRDGTMVQAKLTAKQVLEIRKRSCEKQCKLAREFGVSNVTIHKILSRKLWSHI